MSANIPDATIVALYTTNDKSAWRRSSGVFCVGGGLHDRSIDIFVLVYLAASLLAVVVLPFVHGRAERLTIYHFGSKHNDRYRSRI